MFSSANLSGWNSWCQVSASIVFQLLSEFFFFPTVKEAIWSRCTGDTRSAEGRRVSSRSLGRPDWHRVCSRSWRWKVVRARLEAAEKQGWGMGVVWRGTERYSANQTWGLQGGRTWATWLGTPNTRTSCRKDRRTQQNRDFSGGEEERRERSKREIETRVDWRCPGLGAEVTEMIGQFWVQRWWTSREGAERHLEENYLTT